MAGTILNPVKAVLFDLDDTLFDHRAASGRALAAVREAVPAFKAVAYDELERRHAALLETLHTTGVLRGVMSVQEARETRFRRLLGELGADAPAEEVSAIASRYRAAYMAARCPVPGARALLGALRPHVRLGVVSNNLLAEQQAKLVWLGMQHFFDTVVTSVEEGVSKPHPAIFLAALSRLGVTPDAAVMVGDCWVSDIAGASGVGMRAVWLNRCGRPCPDPAMAAEIHSLEPASTVVPTVLDGVRID